MPTSSEQPAVRVSKREPEYLDGYGVDLLFIEHLTPMMVATLDQRTEKLRAMAQEYCRSHEWDPQRLKETPDDELTEDERMIKEILGLIDYIEYLKR